MEGVGRSGSIPLWHLKAGLTSIAGKMDADVALLTMHMEFMSSLLNPNLSLSNHISINPHMAALDIASVIGTWVAAFVAILALVGIIGPVLIWRASRTEQHLAISTIDDDDNIFRSRGIHAGPRIWLFQRLRAPMLNIAPASFEETISLSLDIVKEPISTTKWVQFGMLLQAYGVRYGTGDTIGIRNKKTHLPVHKSWILFWGLKGRYCKRRDFGRLGSHLRTVVILPRGQHHRRFRKQGFLQSDNDSDDVETVTPEPFGPLFGVTGKIECCVTAGDEGVSVLKFQLAPSKDLRNLEPDVLHIREIFLLSVGCIRLQSGGYCSPFESEMAADDESSDSDVQGVMANRRLHYICMSVRKE